MTALTAYVLDRRLHIAVPLLLIACPVLAANFTLLPIPGKLNPVPTVQFLPLVASALMALTLPERLSWVLPARSTRVALLRAVVAIFCMSIPVVAALGVQPALARSIIGVTLVIAATTYFLTLLNISVEWVAALAAGSIYLLLPPEATSFLNGVPVLVAAASALFLTSVAVYAIRYRPNSPRD